MRKHLSKTEAENKIAEFFQHPQFTQASAKKIKRLAMKHRINLKQYKKLFCKKCLSQLKGSIRVSKTHKTIICNICKNKNKFKIS